jgi:hypothetical protein
LQNGVFKASISTKFVDLLWKKCNWQNFYFGAQNEAQDGTFETEELPKLWPSKDLAAGEADLGRDGVGPEESNISLLVNTGAFLDESSSEERGDSSSSVNESISSISSPSDSSVLSGATELLLWGLSVLLPPDESLPEKIDDGEGSLPLDEILKDKVGSAPEPALFPASPTDNGMLVLRGSAKFPNWDRSSSPVASCLEIFTTFALSSSTNAKVTHFLWICPELLSNNVAGSLKRSLKTTLPPVGITLLVLPERLLPRRQVSSKGMGEWAEVQGWRSSTKMSNSNFTGEPFWPLKNMAMWAVLYSAVAFNSWRIANFFAVASYEKHQFCELHQH